MMGFEDVANKLMKTDTLRQTTWDGDTLATWLRDGFRCVYCGFDLLPSYDIMYFFSCRDHLLPVSKYPELQNTAWNLLLSCRPCNAFKSNWDPNLNALYEAGALVIMEENRAELISRAKEYIRGRREERNRLFESEQALIRAELVKVGARERAAGQSA